MEELTHWKRLWCWEGLGAGGEGDGQVWDGLMASLTEWTWVWVDFGSCWWTGRPGVLRFMVSQRVGHDWVTDLIWSEYDFGTDHLVMSICSLLFCCWKMVFAMTSAFSWQNSVSLCPDSFCIPKLILPVNPGVSWLPTFAFQSPIMKKTSFFLVLVLEVLIGLHRTIQLQLLQH